MEGCKVKLMMEHKTGHLCLMMAGWETGKKDKTKMKRKRARRVQSQMEHGD